MGGRGEEGLRAAAEGRQGSPRAEAPPPPRPRSTATAARRAPLPPKPPPKPLPKPSLAPSARWSHSVVEGGVGPQGVGSRGLEPDRHPAAAQVRALPPHTCRPHTRVKLTHAHTRTRVQTTHTTTTTQTHTYTHAHVPRGRLPGRPGRRPGRRWWRARSPRTPTPGVKGGGVTMGVCEQEGVCEQGIM